jgi:hypothetical protein
MVRFIALFRPRDKREAREARNYWRRVKRNGLYAGGILGSLYGAGKISAWLPSVACGATAWIAESLVDSLEGLESDPPRSDYTTVTTRPVARRFYFEALGPTHLERAVSNAAEVTLYAAANLNALVRSVERATGAREGGRPQYVSLQLEAARRFRDESSDLLLTTAEAVETFSSALDTDVEIHEAVERVEKPFMLEKRLDFELPAEALATLYRLGVSIRMLRVKLDPTWTKDPVIDLTRALRRAGEQSAALGEAIRTWEPLVPE